ncbi:MFS transporter [Paenibacillus sp. 481]|uniref:MFS transporter n=1 Tax=Paenibacillus sp. 481 TaxID=2835869 RepID=UPI001E4F714C|nr:MFS transporter [Paenibacillus sp. 481]UHA72114.1 MFS transporter [Paenibacillus sp. 481]
MSQSARNVEHTESRSLFKNRAYSALWVSNLLAILSFSIFISTISWYVVAELKLPQYLGLVIVVASIPRICMMLFGGVLADRVRKSKLMFIAGIITTALLFVLYMLESNQALTFTTLLLICFVMGLTEGIYYPAATSIIPQLVDKSQLQRANTVMHSASELIFFTGPIVSGIIMNYYSISLALLIAAIAKLVHCLFIFPKIIQDPVPEQREHKQSFKADFIEGWVYVKQSPLHISSILIIIMINLFILGPLFLSLPIIVKSMDGTPLHVSFLESAFSLGSLVATVGLSVFLLRKKRGAIVSVCLIMSLILMFVFSQTSSLIWLVLIAMFIGLSSFVTFITSEVIIQETTDTDKMGRVMGIVSMSQNAFDPVAHIVIAVLLSVGFAIQSIMGVMSLIGLIIAVAIVWKGKKLRRTD